MGRSIMRLRTDYRHWHMVATRWRDIDIYAHVNNVEYYTWFDTVVQSWLIEQGLLDLGSSDPIGLVVETGCRYAAPIGFPQNLDIGLSVARIGNSSVTYHLGIFPQGEVAAAAEGHFTHVYVDRAGRRPVSLPPRWRSALETLLE